MAKMFSNIVPENRGSCTYFLVSLFLFKFSGKKIHKGLRIMFRHFCRTLVIVKSSELTGTRRKEGKRDGISGKKVLDGLFFGNEVKILGSQGEKRAKNQARKIEEKKPDPK